MSDMAKQVGLKLSKAEIKLMRTNSEQEAPPITLEGSEIEVNEYL